MRLLRRFCKKKISMEWKIFSIQNLTGTGCAGMQYLGIIPVKNTCRMSDGWSLRRICKKDLGMKNFLYTSTVLFVLFVYAMVSFQCRGIILRQNFFLFFFLNNIVLAFFNDNDNEFIIYLCKIQSLLVQYLSLVSRLPLLRRALQLVHGKILVAYVKQSYLIHNLIKSAQTW